MAVSDNYIKQFCINVHNIYTVGIFVLNREVSRYELNEEKNLKEAENMQEQSSGENVPKRWKIFGVEFVYLAFIGICIAFLGWILENAVKYNATGVIDSRYHVLPFISPYVLVSFAFHICFGNIDDLTVFGKKVFKKSNWITKILSNIIVYVTLCLAVFLGELAVGNLYEICFGVKLWHYSSSKYLVTSYAGLTPSLMYGTFAYLIFRLLYSPVLKALRKAPYDVIKMIVIVLGALIIADATNLLVHIIVLGEAPMLWRVKLK